jgi:hypothetical protein
VILADDVIGYNRLAGAEEGRTPAAARAAQRPYSAAQAVKAHEEASRGLMVFLSRGKNSCCLNSGAMGRQLW